MKSGRATLYLVSRSLQALRGEIDFFKVKKLFYFSHSNAAVVLALHHDDDKARQRRKSNDLLTELSEALE